MILRSLLNYFKYDKPEKNKVNIDDEQWIDPSIKNQIREILESHVAGQGEAEREVNNRKNVLDLGGISLPTVKYYSKNEAKRVKLLLSIADLGDIREVPFLQHMLAQENNHSIANLIEEIIFKLLTETPEDRDRIEELAVSDYFGTHYTYNYLTPVIHGMLDSYINSYSHKTTYKNEDSRVGGKSATKAFGSIHANAGNDATMMTIDFEVGVSEIKVTKGTGHTDQLEISNMEVDSLIAKVRKAILKLFK